MDDQDKLNWLRNRRSGRNRSQVIEETWKKIGRDEDLSVKEKLERLVTLTRKDGGKAGRPQESAPLAKGREPLRVIENPYRLETSYGKIPLALSLQVPGEILSFLSRDPEFGGLDLSTSVMIDLETTGLSGGTGTVPFLVGLGYFRDGGFKVRQYFLGDIGEEGRMIRELGEFFGDMGFRSVVSYNGKAFDLPILETRFALQRTSCRLNGLPHLDFLISARQLWKHKYENCRLCHLAREIVQAGRDEDIPSAEIPGRYFQYLRTGDSSLIEPIIYHNEEDILSLLGLLVAGAVLVSRAGEDGAEDADAMDVFGVARMLDRAGEKGRSAQLLEKALAGRLSPDVSLLARKNLSDHFKKMRSWDKALPLWQEAVAADDISGFRELSMHFEHRDKNYEDALRIAEEGWALAIEKGSETWRRDFERRVARIREKMKKAGNPTR